MIPLSRWFVDEAPVRSVAFGREGTRTTSDLRRDVAALVARLAPVSGRDVLLHCDDAYAFAVGLLACARVGSRVLLPPSRQAGALRELAPEAGAALLDGDAPEGLGDVPCWHPLECDPRDAAAPDSTPLARDAALAVLFTSGTTGTGRRVTKALRHLEDEVTVLEQHFGSRFDSDTAVLATVAPQHLYGLLFRVLWPLASGRPFLRSAVLHPEELTPHAERVASFVLISTPATLRHLAARSDLARRADACRAIFSSGGPLSADIARHVSVSLGQAPFEVYGSTETGGVAVRQQEQGDEPWQPMSGVALDLDAGCLAVTSPFVSEGEAGADGAQRFVSGDRAVLDDAGRFSLRGRADRVVKIGEKRLSLPDMEERLLADPSVHEVALWLQEKSGAESRVAAVVAPSATGWETIGDAGRRALAKALGEHLAPAFERVLLPRTWRFVAALPRNAQGKVTTDALRDLFVGESPARAPERLGAERGEASLSLRLRIPHDLIFLDGHFPGRPVVPGVAQVHFALDALGELLSATPAPATMEALKFHEVLLPGAEVALHVELTDGGKRFRFSLADAARAERLHASGRGSLESRP